jgi:hypothetical protein
MLLRNRIDGYGDVMCSVSKSRLGVESWRKRKDARTFYGLGIFKAQGFYLR